LHSLVSEETVVQICYNRDAINLVLLKNPEIFPENVLCPILLCRETKQKLPEIRKFPEKWHFCANIILFSFNALAL